MTKTTRRGAFIASLFFLILSLRAVDARAQQTIVNVPSAEVTQPGVKPYLEFTTTFRPYGSHQYATFLPRVTFGAGHGLELSSGILDTHNSVLGYTTSLTVGGKWRFYTNEQTGTSLTASTQAVFPLRGNDAKSMWLNFAGLHQEVRPTRTRLSGGIFDATANTLRPTNWVGAWASAEQRVCSKFGLMAEWMGGPSAGSNRDLWTAGVNLLSNRHSLKAGYQIADGVNRDRGFVLRYGVSF